MPTSSPAASSPTTPLPDHTEHGRARSAELQGHDPMILILARGNDCPKDHQQHLELARFYPKISGGVHAHRHRSPRTITTPCRRCERPSARSGRSSPTPAASIQKDLDIAEYTDPENDPMIPHTLVLKPGLVVHTVYNGYWFWGRPHGGRPLARPTDGIPGEVRPDWRDSSVPGLREAWDGGGPVRTSTAGTGDRRSRWRWPEARWRSGALPPAPARRHRPQLTPGADAQLDEDLAQVPSTVRALRKSWAPISGLFRPSAASPAIRARGRSEEPRTRTRRDAAGRGGGAARRRGQQRPAGPVGEAAMPRRRTARGPCAARRGPRSPRCSARSHSPKPARASELGPDAGPAEPVHGLAVGPGNRPPTSARPRASRPRPKSPSPVVPRSAGPALGGHVGVPDPGGRLDELRQRPHRDEQVVASTARGRRERLGVPAVTVRRTADAQGVGGLRLLARGPATARTPRSAGPARPGRPAAPRGNAAKGAIELPVISRTAAVSAICLGPDARSPRQASTGPGPPGRAATDRGPGSRGSPASRALIACAASSSQISAAAIHPNPDRPRGTGHSPRTAGGTPRRAGAAAAARR